MATTRNKETPTGEPMLVVERADIPQVNRSSFMFGRDVDWWSDFAGAYTDAFSDVWTTASNRKTWNTVATTLHHSGEDALAWSRELWVITQAGVVCLTEAGSDYDKILSCHYDSRVNKLMVERADSSADWFFNAAKRLFQ